MKTILIYIQFLQFLFVSCNFCQGQKTDKIIIDTTTIRQDNYKIEIISKMLIDSLADSSYFGLTPLLMDQTIRIFNKDLIIFFNNIAINKRLVARNNGLEVKILDNIITRTNILNYQNKHYFILIGYGGCASCTLNEIIDENGKVAYRFYPQNYSEFKNSDTLDVFLKTSKMTEETFNNAVKHSVKIPYTKYYPANKIAN